jgi:hypothetical protein
MVTQITLQAPANGARLDMDAPRPNAPILTGLVRLMALARKSRGLGMVRQNPNMRIGRVASGGGIHAIRWMLFVRLRGGSNLY